MTETGSLGPGGKVLFTQGAWREGERDGERQIQGWKNTSVKERGEEVQLLHDLQACFLFLVSGNVTAWKC